MRTPEAIQQSLIAKQPRGYALNRRGGVWDTLLLAFAARLSEGEKDAEDLLNEINPRTANKLLPDFERVLGPDPCGRDQGEQSLDQRQRRAHQRWTATGGQSIPYFLSIAQMLGFQIEIEEFWPSVANVLHTGQRLIPRGEEFVWRIKLQLVKPWVFRAGRNVAGDRLGGFELSDLECILRRLAPAHTLLVFSYQEQKNGSH